MKKVAILILFMLGCAISEGYAQKVALKSNLLYDATTTMNLGLEIGLVRKWTLDIPVNYNPWKLSDGKRLRHWGALFYPSPFFTPFLLNLTLSSLA